MKTKCITIAIIVLSIFFFETNAQTFNKNTDLLLANFDLLPDDDDVMAAAALGCMLKHPDFEDVNYYAVAGAYGTQSGYTFISAAVPDFFNTLFGSENVNWTNADSDWSASVTRATSKVVAVLNAGGKVFVQEAGQSDFTYDVCQAAMDEGVTLATIGSNVVLVQHSNWNKNNTTTSKMNWLIANADYVKIADGNTSGNGTPNYKVTDTQWMTLAMSADNPNTYARTYWTMADEICENWTVYNNPAIRVGGVDYSDHVECWYIFGVATNGDDVESFWNTFVINDLSTPTDFAPEVSFSTPTHNQFNSNTQHIQFSLSEAAQVELTMYDLKGQEIRKLVNTHKSAGTHYVAWNTANTQGQSVPAGMYLFNINVSGETLIVNETRTMMFLK